MKTILKIICFAALLFPASLHAQITNLHVETYYISDDTDATDSTNYFDDSTYLMSVLPGGSKTYRVYVELVPGSRLIQIYGDSAHALKIKSTENFFNNIDRGKTFGYVIDNTKLKKNTVALDTWITLGKASNKHHGVLKANDPNGTVLHPGNDGGSAGIAGGLLLNNNEAAGIPLTVEDGMLHDSLIVDTTTLGQWTAIGFDESVFAQDSVRSEFISNVAVLRQNSGFISPIASDNNVLVAQLTTKGDISFELNVIIRDTNGVDINYIATGQDSVHTNGMIEKVSPLLTYPPACGCTDPQYLEYSPVYACLNPDSCHTHIVFGCTDVLACNYNSEANFNVPSLCCYPGYCNDRDLAVVCPVLATKQLQIYPNPVLSEMTLRVTAEDNEETKYVIYDSFGRVAAEENISISPGTSLLHIDVSKLNTGIYTFRLFKGDTSEIKMFLKN